MIITIIASTVFVLKIPINVSNYLKMCLKALQLIMISADNHNITRLLLLTIIDSGKNARY